MTTGMLASLRIPLAGKHHCGIDDCRNIAKVVTALIGKHGAENVVKVTTKL